MKRIFDAVVREPYRLFFPLGALLGMFGAGHWLAYGLGWTSSYSGHTHAFIQTSLYMGCFATGFLMTAIPKFADTFPATRAEVGFFLTLILLSAALVFGGHLFWAEISAAALLAALTLFVGRRFRKRAVKSPPTEFVWIPFAFLHGIAGHGMVALSLRGVLSKELFSIGRPMAEQGFLLALVAGIGGFLGPRLMGVPIEFKTKQNGKFAVFVFSAAALFLTFCVPFTPGNTWILFVRAILVTAVLAWDGALLLKPPLAKGLLAKIMAVSFWMIVLGLWSSAFFPKHKIALMHFVFLGGFSLMTFGVATMVVYSHGGEGLKLQRPVWALRAVFLGVLAALALRVAADFSPDAYFSWLAAAAGVWVVTDAVWLVSVVRLFVTVPALGTFEAQHEKMKEKAMHSC